MDLTLLSLSIKVFKFEKKIVQLFFSNVDAVFDVMVLCRNRSPCLCATHMPLLSVPQLVT